MEGKEKRSCYGAVIERGVIRDAGEDGCLVESIDRYGIRARIPAIGSGEYSVNDQVYFFLFPDGTGAVIGLIADV